MVLKDLNMLIPMSYHNEMSYMRGEDIENRILEYLGKQEWPSTTEDIAKGIKVSWNTAEVHLVRLQVKEKVKFRKVGRQNQWWLNRNYKKNMKS